MAVEPQTPQTPEGQAPEATPQEPEMQTVELDGAQLTLPKNMATEVQKGYLRQARFTAKMQKLAEERKTLQTEREALDSRSAARPQSGLGGAQYGGPSGPSPVGTVGGAGAFAPLPTYPGREYPAATPSAPSGSLSDDLDDPATKREMQDFLGREVGRMQQQQAAEIEQLKFQMEHDAAQRRVAEMESNPRMPGFSRQAVAEAFYSVDEAEQRGLEGLPPDTRAELIYHRYIAPQISPQQPAAAQTPQGEGQRPERPPFAEGTAGANVAAKPPLTVDKSQGITHENAGAFLEELGAK